MGPTPVRLAGFFFFDLHHLPISETPYHHRMNLGWPPRSRSLIWLQALNLGLALLGVAILLWAVLS
jgi:hypothetical protein